MQKLSPKFASDLPGLVLKTEQPIVSQKGLSVISTLHFKSPESEAEHHILHTGPFYTNYLF